MMPAIPEFVLRKLFIPGSLKPTEVGFELQLNNTLAPVTLTGLGITADEQPCAPQDILLSLPSADERTADKINSGQPFDLPLNTLVGIGVRAPMPRKMLVIRADTRQAGVLQFSLPLQGTGTGGGARLGLGARFKRSYQSALRTWRARRDPQHPRYHFTPHANWMNDPNGLIYWKGTYHLFYQYNPFDAVWGNIHWGHASSADLLHWEHHPIALAPTPGGPDSGGCFSGCAVDNAGKAALIYTGVFPETQCLARGTGDDLLTWEKHPLPLISAPPEAMQVEGFRDPCVWKEGSLWRMALGTGFPGEGGAVLLYGSDNLLEWQYLGILYQKDPHQSEEAATGTMWECPSFFPLGEKWVLIISACDAQGPIQTFYFIGEFHDNRFTPDGPLRRLDHGAEACFYAPQTFLGAHGERLMLGWLRETRSSDEMKRAGWSGAMSLPRILSLSAAGELVCAPLPGAAGLRGTAETLEKAGQLSVKVPGARLEALVRVGMQSAGWNGIHLTTGKPSAESILIGWDLAARQVVVDCRQAGGVLSRLPVDRTRQDELSLRIFVDSSLLEVFVDDSQAISARFYVEKPQTLRVQRIGEARTELWDIKQ